jgi:hypothetical protein
MAAEAIEGTMQDLSDGTEGQKGYVIGRIVFEVGSLVFPAAKANLLAKLGKVEVFNHLMTKGRLIGAKARQAMTALRTPLQVTRMCFVAGTLVKAKQGLIKIEDVRPGMEVWSRDEFTQQEGWKPVVQTFITHPAELHHLTYELRGPPESGPLSPRMESETLGVTAPHPFWVSNRSQPGFAPAGELRAGDELRLANGGRAIVTANTPETAPLGETFTTYNFEVADFHTYFAGRGEVWVHNTGKGPCELILSIYKHFRSRASGAETPWDTLLQTRSAMVDDGFDLSQGVAVSGLYWRRTVKVVNDEMFGQVASGGMSLQKLPSHRQIVGEFSGSGLGSTAPKRLNDLDALESHHIVEKWLQDRLQLSGAMTGDDIPGFITTFTQHRASGTTPLSIASSLRAAVGSSTDPLTISTALKNTYLNHGLDDVWEVTRKYLVWKGVPVPP